LRIEIGERKGRKKKLRAQKSRFHLLEGRIEEKDPSAGEGTDNVLKEKHGEKKSL